MKLLLLFYLVLECLLGATNGAKILGIFPLPAKSHFSCNHAILKSLHAAGHHVTMISPFPSETKLENFTDIDSRFDNFSLIGQFSIEFFRTATIKFLFDFAAELESKQCNDVMKLKEIQEVMQSSEKLYDIIFVEYMVLYDCYLPIAEKLGIPLIATVTLHSWKPIDNMVGMPNNPAVIPLEFNDMPRVDMNFLDRIQNIWSSFVADYNFEKSREVIKKFYTKHFPENLLYKKDASLIFYNNHPIILPRSVPPNVIEIGGIHVQPAKSLPKDFQTFIDRAPHGVILFSLGSAVKGNSLSLEQRRAFLAAFASIPQKVIWKYEETIENLPENIMLSKWLPQRDILEHENVIAFISHCGQSGVYEAISTGTPVVTFPIFGDQPSNAAFLQWRKVGVNLDFNTLTKESVLSALNTIINDTSYYQRMQQLSRAFKDRPMTPQESVVYWTEHVIKHNGAPHLRALGTDMPLYKYLMLDILLFALIALSAVILICIMVVRKVMTRVTEKLKSVNQGKKEK